MKIIMRMMRWRFPASKFFLVSALQILIFLNACNEDPTFLGRELLPPSDDMITRYVDSITIRSFPEPGKPILTASNTSLLLGSLHDSIFGFSKADLMARFDVSPRTIAEGFRIDSMVLELNISGHYGDSSLQTMRIYALKDTIYADSSYLSNTLPDDKYDFTELAASQVRPNDTLARFRITDENFIQNFEAKDDSIFSDPEDFYNSFLGLYITSDAVAENGAIIYINSLSDETRFSMYYQDDDTSGTKQLLMNMTEFTPRVNSFYHDYAGSRVENLFGKSASQDTLAFISAMGGVNTKLYLPNIEQWLDKKPVAINKAEFILPVEDTLITGYSKNDFPPKLLLFSYNEEDNYDFTYDYRVDNTGSKSFYDGNFDPVLNAYVFNIGVHLQSYIQGKIDNLNLVLLAASNQLSASRVILKSPVADTKKMQIKITYTEF